MDKDFIKTALIIISLFLIESFTQVFYFTVRIKWFTKYMSIYSFYSIFKDTAEVVFRIKTLLFLPIYLFYYLFFKKRENIFQSSLVHLLLFFSIYLILGFLMPAFVFQELQDLFVLPIFAFISYFIVGRAIPVYKEQIRSI